MSNKEIFFLLSLSISFPLIAGLFTVKRMDRHKSNILPLVICLGLGFIVEMIDFQIGNSKVFNEIINGYILLETLLLLIQYSIWNNTFKAKEFWIIGLFTCGVWAATSYIIGLENRNAVFSIYYSFLLIVVSINTVNRLFFNPHMASKKYIIIISLAFLVYWTYSMFVELIIFNYALFSVPFVVRTFYIESVLNCVTNLIIAYGLLCIPRKPKYLLFFS